jgi:hypothetical protein
VQATAGERVDDRHRDERRVKEEVQLRVGRKRHAVELMGRRVCIDALEVGR